MKIAICDDREDDRGALKALLEAYGQDFEIKEYGSGKSLCGDMDYIRKCRIIFLDINMEGLDGLETAKQIKAKCPKVHIVLVTAYVNYALDGYKVKASRFLLKDDLDQTLQECMDDILWEIRQEERMVEFDFVEGNMRLKADDIIYIETSKHKDVFYTQGRTVSKYKKMDELEEDLKGMGFVRIHQSFLINMKYVERISSYIMILTTGKEISVPKSRYQEVKRQYTLFKGAE